MLTPDEFKKSREINERYEIDDPIEGLLKKHFLLDPTQTTWWTPTDEILSILYPTRTITRGDSMALGTVLKRLKHEHKRQDNSHSQRVWGYFGVQVFGQPGQPLP